VPAKVYGSEAPTPSPMSSPIPYLRQDRAIAQYFSDAAAGTLPQVAYVDPIFLAQGTSRATSTHPPTCKWASSRLHDRQMP